MVTTLVRYIQLKRLATALVILLYFPLTQICFFSTLPSDFSIAAIRTLQMA